MSRSKTQYFAVPKLYLAFAFLSVFLFVASQSGCKKTPHWPQAVGLTAQTAVLRLQKDCDRRIRIEGLLNARMKGIKGLWANADVDVAAENPKHLHLAVRSFFEQPLQVMATDGEVLTIYDATSSDGPRFYQGNINNHNFGSLLPISLGSEDVVRMLLGCASLDDAALDLSIDEWEGTYSVSIHQSEERRKIIKARLGDDVLLETRIVSESGVPILQVGFEAHKEIQGIPFAHQWKITAHTQKGIESFRLKGRDLRFNGPPLDPAIFRIPTPPGFDVLPLPQRNRITLP